MIRGLFCFVYFIFCMFVCLLLLLFLVYQQLKVKQKFQWYKFNVEGERFGATSLHLDNYNVNMKYKT